jgi:hypothetical protein
LISSVIVKVVDTSETWKNKRVKKTMQSVGLFVRAAKILVHSDKSSEVVNKLNKQGMLIIKCIEKECEKDKSMSNLKGKIKEIKTLISNV